jgi:hypothetical protein
VPSAGAKQSPNSLRARVDAIREITGIFWVERAAYLVLVIVSLLLLLACAGVALYRGQIDETQKIIGGISLAGSSGGASGLLFMWQRSVTIAFQGEGSAGAGGGKDS